MPVRAAWRAPWRWVRADLRAHWGQAALTGGIVAAVVAWLVLAAMLLEGANSPWQGLYDRTRGADVVLTLPLGTPAGALAGLAGVREASPPIKAVSATLTPAGVPSPPQVQLRAVQQDAEPAMSAPLVVEGSWLSPAHWDGVVVEASLAAATRLRVGSPMKIAAGGVPVSASVIGIAETADQGSYPQTTPGLIWVTQALLHHVAPDSSGIAEVVDLRLADRCAVCVTDVVNEVGSVVASHVGSATVQAITWQQVSQQMAASGWLFGELLGTFGLIALAAAACAIANVTAAQSIAQRQATATLKSIGFTPAQVAGALLGENVLLAAAGTAVGLAAAEALSRAAPAIPRPGGVAVTLAPLPGGLTVVIAGGTVLAVVVATVVQAWRSARVPPTAAVTASPPRGKLSRLARVGLVVRFPAPLVLGTRDAFTRRALASLTIAGVAIPMALVTIALASWATIGALTADPGRISLPALVAYPSAGAAGAAQAQVKQAIQDGQVQAAYPGAQFRVPLPGQAGTFTARAMGTVTGPVARPYPFRIVAGRNYQAPGEAVASQRLLAELGLRVGSRTWVTINGVPVVFRIVGQVIDPAGNGDVLDFPMEAIEGTSPQFYSLVLAQGASPASVAASLQAASGGRLSVQPASNPAASLGPIRLVIVASVLALATVGLANLVTATRAGLRDHLPEASVLAAVGLTPAQVTATYVAATTILAVTGVLAGTVAGLAAAHWLINARAASIGLGWGIEPVVPAPGMVAAAMLLAVLAGTGTALLVVRRSVVARRGLVPVRHVSALAGPFT